LFRFITEPSHTTPLPLIVAGSAFTVIVFVVVQLVASVYVNVVLPDITPLTTPDASIVAVPGALLLHVPPLVAFSAVIV